MRTLLQPLAALALAGARSAEALETVWGHCTAARCFKLLGPHQSLDQARAVCNQLGGQLAPGADEAEARHVQAIYDSAGTGPGTALLLGADVDEAGGVRLDQDGGQAVEQLLDAFAFDAGAGEGACVQSSRDAGNDAVVWRRIACRDSGSEVFAVCGHATPEYGFCYEVRWHDEQNRLRKRVMEPITRFPDGHPKSQQMGVCGAAPFGFVPPNGNWSEEGARDPSDPTCTSKSGGELFYAYNHPSEHSSNTGFADNNGLVMLFVVDTSYHGYMVMSMDKPGGNDNDNGMLELEMSGRGLAGKGVEVLLKDDPSDKVVETCSLEFVESEEGEGKDCYAWNATRGSGNFVWKWNKCCTDGLVLGRLPSDDFCLSVKVNARRNLNQMLLGEFNSATQSIELSEIAFDTELDVCGYTCPDYCSIPTCGECSQTPGCGWCPGRGCEPIGAKGGCARGWKDLSSEECCSECEGLGHCGECLDVPGCGWDHERKRCRAGNPFSRSLCQTPPMDPNALAFTHTECLTPKPTRAPTVPSASPTDSPSSSPTAAPTGSPTVTPRPTRAPTNHPSRGPSEAPSTAPIFTVPQRDTSSAAPSVSNDPTPAPAPTGPPDDRLEGGVVEPSAAPTVAPDQSGLEAWLIALVASLGVLSGCCCFWCLALAARRRRRRQREEEAGQVHGVGGHFDSIDKAPAFDRGMLSLTPVGAYSQSNPMVDDLALRDGAGGTNALVKAIKAHKDREDIFHVYTNNPGVAMTLSGKSRSFVKCTEDSGKMLDQVAAMGPFTSLFRLAGSRGSRKGSPKVKTELRVMKRDEWTAHTCPTSGETFYYNGKLNKVRRSAEGIRLKESAKADPLRWEFAPDEFDDFDNFVELLKQDRWECFNDLHMTYYVNPRTKERVWIEPS